MIENPAGRTRIAPTPSGFLHAGNAFNFLLTARLAAASGSRLVLRIDDLDQERTRPEYLEDIFLGLEWLGVRWDEGPSGPTSFMEKWSQCHRVGRYREAAMKVRAQGLVYPCPHPRSEFGRLERATHTCREQRDGPTEGVAMRLRIPLACTVSVPGMDGTRTLVDLSADMPDPVLEQRGTGTPAYQLASLCDDVEMGMTFIVRGVDLLPSTACQLFLADRLGMAAFQRIRFLHHPLALDQAGGKLSKSAGSRSLRAMRASGEGPDRILKAVDRYLDHPGSELDL